MTHKTQGTELYVLNNQQSPVAVLKLGGLTSIGELGGTASSIDTTTMDDLKYKRSESGLIDPGSADLGYLYDMDSDGQQFLTDNVTEQFEFAIGYSNGFGIPPTVNGSDDGFELPTTRGWSTFTASVNKLSKAFGMDDVVKLSSALKVSGPITDTAKST